MIETVVIIIFILLLLNYVHFILEIYSGLNKVFLQEKPKIQETNNIISVIIPFRNESKTILNSLLSIEKQVFSKDNYEVIYINDCSTDDSLDKILQAEKSSNVKVISVDDNFSNAHKKRTVKLGIDNSIGNIIVTTDCDCLHGVNWLSSLVSYFDKETAFVAGPVIFKDDSYFFNKLQKLEFAGLVLSGAGLIGINKPVICNAANIAYRKDVFERVNGFKDDMQLSSGDDELLMQRIASETNYKIKFCTSINSIVTTNQNSSLKDFMQQRKRWASKGLFYKNKSIILKLVLIYLFYCSLLFLPFLVIFTSESFLWIFIVSFITKTCVELLVLMKGINFLFDKRLLNILIFAELFQIPYIVIAGILGAFGNYTWKEREIKR